MILTEFDKDAYEAMIREEGFKEGFKEGWEEGYKEGIEIAWKFDSLQSLIENGIPEEEGMRLLGFTEDDISLYHHEHMENEDKEK
ncbi:MAG: hypothetical protein Q4C63_09725 [Eubacteriales bacterium]|nr:hypothetical protein [Eubacteriales bacterium]